MISGDEWIQEGEALIAPDDCPNSRCCLDKGHEGKCVPAGWD